MSDEVVEDVRYPGLRGDVTDALKLFAELDREAVEQRVGDLTNAVHWLVDDTFWDMRDASEDIGYRLRDHQEVAAIKAVLDPLLVVLDELGPVAPDVDYLDHRRWPEVVTSARAAHRLLVANDEAAR
ncbi:MULTISPECIES: SCO4402 family protein [Saccharothrix]|uniref:SCO4402 family protein n=1 Tax=Saccharothrix TaxID=2071 RepID=UPI00093C6C4E|nr:hypothetical protein [Saccharothrix sp. CB00851]OKI20302.1 hypothetical protein A6A25_38215 [Saccharothrix sp. CB00851]